MANKQEAVRQVKCFFIQRPGTYCSVPKPMLINKLYFGSEPAVETVENLSMALVLPCTSGLN